MFNHDEKTCQELHKTGLNLKDCQVLMEKNGKRKIQRNTTILHRAVTTDDDYVFRAKWDRLKINELIEVTLPGL